MTLRTFPMDAPVSPDPPHDAPRPPRALDRNGGLPLYHQLYVDLRARLLHGEWKPGDPFPKDTDIEAEYGVSRITVRQAMAHLVDSNFVIRYRGRGSFVGSLPRKGARTNHRTIAGEIEEAGRRASHRNLGIERHPVSELTAEQLGIEVGAEVTILKRLHLADDQPVCFELVMLATEGYPDIFDRVMRDEETLAAAYVRHGIEVAKSDQTVSAFFPSEERRVELGIDRDTPVLFVERVGHSATGAPLDLRRLYYRSDLHPLRQEIVWGSADRRIVKIG